MDAGCSVQLSHCAKEDEASLGDVTLMAADGTVLASSQGFQSNANKSKRHELAPVLAAEAAEALKARAAAGAAATEAAGGKSLGLDGRGLHVIFPLAIAGVALVWFAVARTRS